MSQHSVANVREAKHVLEQELNKAVKQRLDMFREMTGIQVEAVQVDFTSVRMVGSAQAVPVFAGVQVKLEDL